MNRYYIGLGFDYGNEWQAADASTVDDVVDWGEDVAAEPDLEIEMEIDWGGDTTENVTAEIDWGMDGGDGDVDGGDIDWGNPDEATTPATGTRTREDSIMKPKVSNRYGVSILSSYLTFLVKLCFVLLIHPSSIIHHPSSIIHHPSSIIHHLSSIIYVYRDLRESVLDNPRERALFVNDLLELHTFLSQRCHELSSPDTAGHLTYNALSSAAPIVKNTDAKTMRAWTDCVGACVNIMSDARTRSLITIKSSPVYVDRWVTLASLCFFPTFYEIFIRFALFF